MAFCFQKLFKGLRKTFENKSDISKKFKNVIKFKPGCLIDIETVP
jgi:hypothetical protein